MFQKLLGKAKLYAQSFIIGIGLYIGGLFVTALGVDITSPDVIPRILETIGTSIMVAGLLYVIFTVWGLDNSQKIEELLEAQSQLLASHTQMLTDLRSSTPSAPNISEAVGSEASPDSPLS